MEMTVMLALANPQRPCAANATTAFTALLLAAPQSKNGFFSVKLIATFYF